jgi:hypothetical protein
MVGRYAIPILMPLRPMITSACEPDNPNKSFSLKIAEVLRNLQGLLKRLPNLLERNVTENRGFCKSDAVAAVRFRLIKGQICLDQNIFDEMETPVSA